MTTQGGNLCGHPCPRGYSGLCTANRSRNKSSSQHQQHKQQQPDPHLGCIPLKRGDRLQQQQQQQGSFWADSYNMNSAERAMVPVHNMSTTSHIHCNCCCTHCYEGDEEYFNSSVQIEVETDGFDSVNFSPPLPRHHRQQHQQHQQYLQHHQQHSETIELCPYHQQYQQQQQQQQHRHHHHHHHNHSQQHSASSHIPPLPIKSSNVLSVSDHAIFPLSPEKEEGEPVDYEYYVWDAVAQEYVRTDRQTGEKMLQDPQYFQYHYRLVENAEDGETLLLPEPLNNAIAPWSEDQQAVLQQQEPTPISLYSDQRDDQMCPYPHPDAARDLCHDNEEDTCIVSGAHSVEEAAKSSFSQRAPHLGGGELLQPPHSLLVTPRQGRLDKPVSAQSRCAQTQQQGMRRCREVLDKENCSQPTTSSTHHRLQDCATNSTLTGHATGWGHEAPNIIDRRCNKTPGTKGVECKLDEIEAISSIPRFFISCSRPWENPSASMRDRDLQLRQLRHLQRVQELERDELFRRQLMLDEMAAALPKSSQLLLNAENNSKACRDAKRPAADRRMKNNNRFPTQAQQRDLERRTRTDPVNRGRYFRDVWKSDRFLEQQRHPTFDVKAYDAWLKNSGHLIRGRALELQQEEQRLLSKLQQERSTRLKRCGY
ncbi:hypothetical protein, conserved [Eimeria maxima]|uniref:Uncharacterized protein n=1 Tax=Eimeria maxima TaxID=5804 RepID=U6MJG7_EIMMA|nr:hypothetical protein, conserved [Eimeria maxima]CDJ61800.1 hypothetical protein, conserved [Eimeria maxima]